MCDEYDKFLVDNIVKEKLYKESPHIVISKHFHLIKKFNNTQKSKSRTWVKTGEYTMNMGILILI